MGMGVIPPVSHLATEPRCTPTKTTEIETIITALDWALGWVHTEHMVYELAVDTAI